MKTSSIGRCDSLQIWGRSDQWFLRYSTCYTLRFWDQPKIRNRLQWRRPSLEDDLKVLQVEYIRNHWSDHPQIWNLSLGNVTKIKDCLQWRQLLMEDVRKILRFWYLYNHLLDFPQLLNLSLGDQTKRKNCCKWRWPQIVQLEYLRNHWPIHSLKLKLKESNKNWKLFTM